MSMGWKENPDIKKLYVGSLSPDTTEDKIREHFGQYGQITELNLVRTPEGKSKCFCFVSFSDCDAVDNILFNYESHSLDMKKLEVKRAIPRGDPNPLATVRTKKLFIGGLKDDQTEDDIKTALASMTPYPPDGIKLMRDRVTNKFKGFAFVNFSNENIVDKLYIIRKIEIKGRPAEMKKAEEFGAGGGDRGGMRGGRGAPRGRGFGGRGGGRGRGGGASTGSNYGGYGGGSGYEGYGGYGSYGSDGYSGGYDQSGYNGGSYDYSGYGGTGGYGGGYGGGSSMGQYSQEPSGYGPSRGRGRGRGAAGAGGGYRPY